MSTKTERRIVLERDMYPEPPYDGIYKPDVFERYARVWFGARSFAWREEREGWNVALDPADWREWAGLTDEHMAKYPDIDFTASLGEYEHYLNGDVWFATVQEKCDHGEWHTIDLTGGLYGEEGDPQLRQYADEILEEADDE